MYDAIVIGCGITGSAIAFELSKYNLKIAVLERENDVATGATKANSAIIHAGYDPKEGSLMAKLNVRGSVLANKLCKKLDVPYENCGAVVVAFSEKEMDHVKALKARGDANGVKGLRVIGRDELKEKEPLLSEEAVGALWAPSSAIVSPWEYCLALAETAVKNGAELFLNNEVKEIIKTEKGFAVKTNAAEYEAKYVINASGCDCDKVHDMAAEHSFSVYPARGQYFLMDKEEHTRANCTIFQCPNEKGKGVLVSPTVHGNLIVGPDSEAVEGEDKSTTTAGLNYVREVAKKSVPSIDFRNSIRNFAGVRARTGIDDFIIEEAKDAPGFIDAAGICSPGLSSAPAIGEYISAMVLARMNGKKLSDKELFALEDFGLSMFEDKKKADFICERSRVHFKALSPEKRAELIGKNPAYGRVVCRCETVTEGEILDSFNTPIPPVSVDGVKRRVGAGLGRCQGGFCGPNVVAILAEKLGVPETEIVQEGFKSWMLTNMKEGSND